MKHKIMMVLLLVLIPLGMAEVAMGDEETYFAPNVDSKTGAIRVPENYTRWATLEVDAGHSMSFIFLSQGEVKSRSLSNFGFKKDFTIVKFFNNLFARHQTEPVSIRLGSIVFAQ